MVTALSFVLLPAISAHARLGGTGPEIAAEAGALHARTETLQFADYSIRTLTAEGLVVRQYLDSTGGIFAVAWNSVAAPDLQMLLGAYFPRYTAMLAGLEHPGLQRSLRMADAGFVVESSGHLRAYTGRAWLTAGVPSTVSLADIR